MSKLIRQEVVDRGCRSAQERYASMDMREALLSFSYELQGFVADAVERGKSMDEAFAAIDELVDMLDKANEP